LIKNVHIFAISNYKINKILIHKLLSFLKKELKISINSLELNFIEKEEIILINKQYLGHNYSTDILTFNYNKNNNSIDGEIFISVDDALENSKKFKVSLSNELYRLVIHGILHLLGFDDREKKDKKIMKVQENLLLNNFCKLLRK